MAEKEMGNPSGQCVFCEIVGGRAPASTIFEDELVMAIMVIRPTSPGEFMVIPRLHIDHFTDPQFPN